MLMALLLKRFALLLVAATLSLLLVANAGAQSCGQANTIDIAPQTLINDTIGTTFYQPLDGSPGFLALGTVTVTAQGCPSDIDSGLDVRATSPDGSVTVLGDAQLSGNSPQTVVFPLSSPKLLVSTPTEIRVTASVIAFGQIVSTISSSYTLLPFNPTFSITPSQIRAGSGQTVVGTLVLDAPAALFSLVVGVNGAAAGDVFVASNSRLNGACVIPSPSFCALFYDFTGGQSTFTFEISARSSSSQPETLTVTVDWGGGVRTATLKVLAPQQQNFQLEILQDDGNNINTPALSKFKFDNSRAEVTSNAQRVKLGQLFTARIVPLNADGTDGSPVTLTETISDAVPDSFPISPIPMLSGASGTDLFLDKVLLHFPKSTTAPQHQYFGIHGGPATLNLAFQSGNSPLTVHVPIQVVACTDSSSSCSPALGSGPADFDQEIMLEADIRGIPPQLIKAQIGQESSFNPNAYRYEPLSIDFALVGLSPAQLKDKRLAPWRLAASSDCAKIPADLAQGTSLNLGTKSATSRSRFQIQLGANSAPLCHVTDVDQGESTRNILPSDALISMENILYTSDSDSRNNWQRINRDTFNAFQGYQDNGGKPFTAQTVISASYGLHQVLYTTAAQQQGFIDSTGAGSAPALLFDPGISLFLGSEYLAEKYQNRNQPEDLDFDSLHDLFFHYGPALRAYNAGIRASQLSFDEINQACGNAPLPPVPPSPNRDPFAVFRYACGILNGRTANVFTYSPAPLNP